MTIEQEIWDEFSELSGYSLHEALSYGTVKSHLGIDYEITDFPRVNGVNGSQFLYKDADRKIDKALLVNGEINWEEIIRLYPKSEIKFKYNYEPQKYYYEPKYPPAQFRTKKEWREIQEIHLTKWEKQKEGLHNLFPNEDKAYEYLFNKRWEDDVFCPHCNSVNVTQLKGDNGKRFQCNSKVCRNKFSVTVGTIFQNTKISLTKWYEAIFLLTNTKTCKLSTPQLGKAIDVTQKTAFYLKEKIIANVTDKFIQNIGQDLFYPNLKN